jgi:protein translocase SecG subunit
MGTVLLILQILSALIFIALMAVQTDKNEQSGVMGLGGQGGRMSGSIDMPVGAERILKPMSKWTAIGFLFSSLLAAANSEMQGGLPWYILIAAIAIYAFVMLFGDKVWAGFLRTLGASQ